MESDRAKVAEQAGEAPDADAQARRRRTVIIVSVAAGALFLVGGALFTAGYGRLGSNPPARNVPVAEKTGNANAVATPGQALLRVVNPPENTRTAIRLSVDLGSPTYAITFEPYGITSTGAAVIKVTAIHTKGGSPLAAKFGQQLVGQNLQVTLAPDSLEALRTGGSYTSNMSLVKKGATTYFSVSGVHRGG